MLELWHVKHELVEVYIKTCLCGDNTLGVVSTARAMVVSSSKE